MGRSGLGWWVGLGCGGRGCGLRRGGGFRATCGDHAGEQDGGGGERLAYRRPSRKRLCSGHVTAPPVARMNELTMLRGRNSLRPEWYGAQQVPFSTGGLQECDCRQFARNLHSGWVACGAPRPMETERCTRILPARRREPDRRSPHSRKWRCGPWLWVGTGRLVLRTEEH